mgnify:CR=1 FL=1
MCLFLFLPVSILRLLQRLLCYLTRNVCYLAAGLAACCGNSGLGDAAMGCVGAWNGAVDWAGGWCYRVVSYAGDIPGRISGYVPVAGCGTELSERRGKKQQAGRGDGPKIMTRSCAGQAAVAVAEFLLFSSCITAGFFFGHSQINKHFKSY